MSGYESRDGRLDVTRLEMALQDLESGTLAPAERDELMALVRRSPAAQRIYLHYFEVSAMLQAEAATHAEQGKLPKVIPLRNRLGWARRGGVAAAAALVLLGATAAIIRVALPTERLILTAAADTRWTVSGKGQESFGQATDVREGSTVKVESGTLKLRLSSGAMMVLQGPAQVSFPELTRPVVRSGWFWLDTGTSGEKFEIGTPELNIRNLGTRFGVKVPVEGSAEVHLVKGKLEVTSEAAPDETLKLAPDQNGLVIPSEGEPTQIAFARDPFPDIAGLLSSPANYSTTVRGQSPSAYWRLEGAPGGILPNEIAGEPAGRPKAGLFAGTAGPGAASGFDGFGPDNRAASLRGPMGDTQLLLGSAPRHQGILFQEVFVDDAASKGNGPLNKRLPGITLNATTWVAGHHFREDGWISPGTASATLAFEPVNGVVYTLDGSFRSLSCPDGTTPWVALGFAGGQSSTVSSGDRFVLGKVSGRAWMLCRGTGSSLGNATHDVGASNPRVWENWSSGVGGDVDMRIILDTTRGYGNWTATYFAKRTGTDAYIEVGPTRALPNEAIRSVGIAVSGSQLQSRITSFSLKAEAVAESEGSRVRVDGPSRLQKSAGSVSCWVRREAGSGRRAVLWSANHSPKDKFMHVRLEADGRVAFFIENGRYDVLLTSEQTLADDRWHHLAATWSPGTADLYLDGQKIAWERESREMLQGNLPELRIGGDPNEKLPAFFKGDVDEFAIWERALTPLEVEQQFKSARGSR